MAENVANVYFTSEHNPSLFEIIAQKSLNATLLPAWRKIAEFFSGCGSNYLGWLAEYHEEAFLVVNGLLQYHYLRHHSASFSEKFYGLKRQQLDDYEITKLQKVLSWFFIVLTPYLKNKLDAKVTELRFINAENSLPKNFKGALMKALVYAHSTYEVTWGSILLLNYLRYISNKTDIALPELMLLNLKLVYSDDKDDFQTFWTTLFQGKLSFSELSVGLFQNAVRSTLEISAFFVQFLRAWNAEKANMNVTALPNVPSPPVHVQANQYADICPICLQHWKITTVLPVSGYVFCFSCIYNYVKENRKCPVTSMPAKPLDVIRLY